MPYKVLIVDDSSFFQSRLKEIINDCSELQVIGIASNGQEAIDKDETLKPDIISMDYEMPMVDGITAVRTILSKRSVPIVMFSSMTYEGARITLEALDAGAVDFIPKNFAEVSKDSAVLKRKLHEKLITFARNSKPAKISLGLNPSPKATTAPEQKTSSFSSNRAQTAKKEVPSAARQTSSPAAAPARFRSGSIKGKIKLLVIGASTGGPVAVTQIVSKLPANFPAAIVVVQHMPENFTRAFAERLNRQSELLVKEAETGDRIEPGHVYVAPGGQQLMFDKNKTTLKIIAGDDRVNYKPCVDISFASAAQIFGGAVHSVVLTGMGADGCEGARLLREKGASVWIQDEATCVVYGMPSAVEKAGLADMILPIDDFSAKLTKEI